MESTTYSKILIAVDGSEHSLKIAIKGLSLARQLGGIPALLFVIDKAKATGNVDANVTPQEAELILKKEAILTFDTITAHWDGSDILRLMPVGNPKEAILKTAEDWQADLIVMGMRGKSGIVRTLMGSVTEFVISHSSREILLVK